jgi:hypothetical protein
LPSEADDWVVATTGGGVVPDGSPELFGVVVLGVVVLVDVVPGLVLVFVPVLVEVPSPAAISIPS